MEFMFVYRTETIQLSEVLKLRPWKCEYDCVLIYRTSEQIWINEHWTVVLFVRGLWLSQARNWISNVICHGIYCVQWVQLRWEVIVRFVDNSGIDDHHCLNFLFIMMVWFRFNNISNISKSQLLWWTALIAQVVVNPTTMRLPPRRSTKY